MSLQTMELFGIYPAIFDDLNLLNVTNVAPEHGAQKMSVTPGGSVDPVIIAEINKKPVINLVGHDLIQILSAVSPLIGLSVTSAWLVQYQAKLDGGTFANSGHVTLSGTKGKLMVDSIEATQDQNTPIDVGLKFWALWDGTTVDSDDSPLPVKVLLNQGLTGVPDIGSSTPRVGGIYKLGPVVFETFVLGGVQKSKVNFAAAYDTTSQNGEGVPRIGTINKRSPSFEVDVHNLSVMDWTSKHQFGSSKAVSGMSVYFRQVGFADNAGAHIKFTLGAGSDYEMSPGGTGVDGKVLTKIMMTGIGTVAMNTGVALP